MGISMKSNGKVRLAENLNRLMKEKKIAMSTTAKKTSINRSTLHSYCNGVIPKHVITVKKLADFFGVTFEELLFGYNEAQSESKPSRRIEGQYVITIRELKSTEGPDHA